MNASKYIALICLFVAHFSFAGVDLVKVDKSKSKMYLLDGGQMDV